MNDAPRRWWNIFHKELCCDGMVPTRADRCCCVSSRERTWKQTNSTHCHDVAFEKLLDPIAGSPATAKFIAGIIDLSVDDLCGTGGNEIEQRVLARL